MSSQNLMMNDKGQIVDGLGNVVGKATKAKKVRDINENTVSLFYSVILPDGREYDGWLTSKDGKNTILKFPSMAIATQEVEKFGQMLLKNNFKLELFELVVGNPLDGLPAIYCEPTVSPAQEEVRGDDNSVIIEAKPAEITLRWLPSESIKKSIERKKTARLINGI